MSMNAPIFYVGGSKGGVGKSKLTFALVDYLTAREHKVLLLETDNSNPDVWKAHQPFENASLVCKLPNLDLAEGWIELVNHCDEFPEHIAVINSAARSNAGMEQYGSTLKETLAELERDMTALWVINRQRERVPHILDNKNQK
jgi:cellulose biosynthesis protein BcsQ